MNRTFAVHRHAVQLSILALMLRGKELARRTTSATPQQLTQSGQTHYSDDVDAHTHGAPDPTPNLPSRYRFFDPGTQRVTGTKLLTIGRSCQASVMFHLAG